MKNVENANFLQEDHKIIKILEKKGVKVLPSYQAWENFSFVREFFKEKPKGGYFIWVKEKIDFPLTTCITIGSKNVSQKLNNLMIIEKGLNTKANVFCYAKKYNLSATHIAKGKLILKEGATLEYNHLHLWGQKDNVFPDYDFYLEDGAKLIYNYKNLMPPQNLTVKTNIFQEKDSSSNLNIIVNGVNSKINIFDNVHLEKEDAQTIVKLRIIGKKDAEISAVSTITAKSKSKGHLDCQGLLVDKNSKIILTPKLVCENKDSQLTHEASIGKISEEEILYLRMRGFTEKEAIELICNGFLSQDL